MPALSRHRARKLAVLATAVLAAGIAGAGCVIDVDNSAPPVIVDPGRLTVRWTVLESIDPNLCYLGRATTIDIVVTTTAERWAGAYRAPCTAFATSIASLYPGNYIVNALLVDPAGRARTTNVQIGPFAIYARTELVIDVDFPASAFLDGFEASALPAAPSHETGALPPAPVSPTSPPTSTQPKETR